MTRVCTSQLWNVDRDCARGLTWVVCSGIMIGNYIKDVFLYAAWVVPPTPGWCVIRILTYDVGRVPRPPSPPVWVPHKTASTDSTALRDYGFPSTHSVNGVTNPTYFIMCVQCLAGACRGHCVVMRLACVCCRYLWRAGYISVNNPYWMAVILVCGLVWLGSLSFGRMYLGVHSPSDVEGGVVRFRASCRGNQEASVRVPTWCCFPGYWRQHHACHILVRHRNRLLDRCE